MAKWTSPGSSIRFSSLTRNRRKKKGCRPREESRRERSFFADVDFCWSISDRVQVSYKSPLIYSLYHKNWSPPLLSLVDNDEQRMYRTICLPSRREEQETKKTRTFSCHKSIETWSSWLTTCNKLSHRSLFTASCVCRFPSMHISLFYCPEHHN